MEGDTRGPFAEASRLPGDMRQAVAAQWGVAEAGGVSYQNVEAQHRGRTLRVLVIGARTARPGEATVVEGRPILRSRYEAVADRGTGLALGEQIKLMWMRRWQGDWRSANRLWFGYAPNQVVSSIPKSFGSTRRTIASRRSDAFTFGAGDAIRSIRFVIPSREFESGTAPADLRTATAISFLST